VISTDGGQARELVRLARPAEFQQTYFGFTWSPDNRFVYFLMRSDAKAPFELFRVPVAGGREEIAGLKLANLRDIDISPDGTHIAFSVGAVALAEVWAIENLLPAAAR